MEAFGRFVTEAYPWIQEWREGLLPCGLAEISTTLGGSLEVLADLMHRQRTEQKRARRVGGGRSDFSRRSERTERSALVASERQGARRPAQWCRGAVCSAMDARFGGPCVRPPESAPASARQRQASSVRNR